MPNIAHLLIALVLILCIILTIQILLDIKNKQYHKQLEIDNMNLRIMKNKNISNYQTYENRYIFLLFKISKTMQNISKIEHSNQKIKNTFFRLFRDLALLSTALDKIIKDDNLYSEVLLFIDKDIKNFINNESDHIKTNTIFNIVEKINEDLTICKQN